MAATTRAAPAEPRTKRWRRPSVVLDAVLTVFLFVVALLFRNNYPRDGLFFDDAWQAFGAAAGGFRQFITVGQTQPGFGLELMVWSRIFGSSASSMVTPAIIAGALGPPALYLVLRKFGNAPSVSFLLGAALTVCSTAILYSSHVKSYTSEVLIILLLSVVVPWLARRTWTWRTGLAWFVGSMLLASFSSFALLACIAAGAVLVFHTNDDRKLRVVAVGAQAVAVLALLAVVARTHNGARIVTFFDGHDAFIPFQLNLVAMVTNIIEHLGRVTAVFPGGPTWFSWLCLGVATVGLLVMARRGRRAIVGRFLILMVAIAVLGSIEEQVPFGPDSGADRVSIWLAPIVAIGLAVVLQRARRLAAEQGRSLRIGFDVVAFVASGLLLLSAVGATRSYPPGGTQATKAVMAEIGPRDVVLITRPTMYTFALDADTPVRLRPTPDLVVGFAPRFKDKRLHPIDFLTKPTRDEVTRTVIPADRVFIVHSRADQSGYKKYRADLDDLVSAQGFEPQSAKRVGDATVSIWQRPTTPAAAG